MIVEKNLRTLFKKQSSKQISKQELETLQKYLHAAAECITNKVCKELSVPERLDVIPFPYHYFVAKEEIGEIRKYFYLSNKT